MKRLLYTTAAAIALAAMTGTDAPAKGVVVPKTYMFGFAASFNDTIVHFTDIQTVDSAWIDSKTKFLMARQQYAAKLRDYLSSQQLPHRTCVVFYDQKLDKLQKKYIKMKKMYSDPGKKARNRNDVRDITASEFRFTTIDMAPYLEPEETQQPESQKTE